MALRWSNRRAGAVGEAERRDTGPCRLIDSSDIDTAIADPLHAKSGGWEALALFNYGRGNVTVKFQRIFPFNSMRSISTMPPWRPSTAASPPVETAFFTNMALYEGLVGGHILIDEGHSCKSVASATLLSPPLQVAPNSFMTLWATAAHNVISEKGRYFSVKVNPQVYQSPEDWFEAVLARDDRLTHAFEIVRCGSKHYAGLFSPDDESPTKYGRAKKLERPTPDLAFCKVICADATWPFTGLQGEMKFCVPNPRRVQTGDFVIKLGYPGNVSKSTFLQKYNSMLPRSQLEAEFQKLHGSIFRRQTFSISPSEIYLVGNQSRVVKDKGSSWPGMSGGATLDLKNPHLLNGVHIGASLDRKFNHFISVHHPFFVCGYAELMGPYLDSIQWPSAEMDGATAEYLRVHEPFLRSIDLWSSNVATFVNGRVMPQLVSGSKRKRSGGTGTP